MTRRAYTNRQRMGAVVAAEMSSIKTAAEEHGVPRKTLEHWMNEPWAAGLRRRTRDEMADDMAVLAHMAAARVVELIPTMAARDAIVALGVAIDKSQLLAGMATSRTESRDLTGTLSDAELIEALREAERITRRAEEQSPEPTEG